MDGRSLISRRARTRRTHAETQHELTASLMSRRDVLFLSTAVGMSRDNRDDKNGASFCRRDGAGSRHSLITDAGDRGEITAGCSTTSKDVIRDTMSDVLRHNYTPHSHPLPHHDCRSLLVASPHRIVQSLPDRTNRQMPPVHDRASILDWRRCLGADPDQTGTQNSRQKIPAGREIQLYTTCGNGGFCRVFAEVKATLDL